ncbi:MAG: type II toxin-antitoxin system VapC family toxin [Chloroflexi bacterium]|nr:type II toxin-antitoxin system VapC family toxin [Chloroflexota bacterium]
MTLFYLDASAFVKRFVPENGTEVVDSLFSFRHATDTFATSLLGVLEVKATLHRLRRGGRLKEEVMGGLLASLLRDLGGFRFLAPVGRATLDRAMSITETHALRAGDTIHLATILEIMGARTANEDGLMVLSSDKELLAACERERLAVINPEDADALGRLQTLRSRPNS